MQAVSAVPALGETRYVNAGGDLQAQLNAAQPGDEIVLQAGATFTGNFRLPVKPAGPAITIRSSAELPDRRITPGDADRLPTIRSGNGASAIDALGAANWRLEGLRFEANVDGHGNVIQLLDVVHITLDRILLVVPDGQQQKRGIAGNGQHVTLTRSHLAGIWRNGQDSQAFCAWDGAGPYTIRDNYLEAASENVMFGGANSKSADRIPADILVEHNHFSKRLAWKGQPRNVKNIFELKQAKRVVIRHNVFERNWTDGQSGWGIVFTVRNDEGGSPWAVVEDVLFEHNIVRDTEKGFNILGVDSNHLSGRTTRITIRHNLVLTPGTFLQVGGEVGELTIDHNTVDNGWSFGLLYKGDVQVASEGVKRPARFAVEKLTITNNLANHNGYGLIGDGTGIGIPALDAMAASYSWTHNVLAGESGWGRSYPAVTWQPSMAEHKANFNSDYSLTGTSVYRNAATDGLDLGAIADGSTGPPPPVEVCGDGIDNDGDGQIDEGCPPPPVEVCGDGIDNDGDGQIDEGCPPPPVEVCGDGIDNDGDGQIDEGCPPPPIEVCGDGIDNDGDGQIDEGCPVTPVDTTGPTVTVWNFVQTTNHVKFRVQAEDPSGIATVLVEFDGKAVANATSVPVNVTIPLRRVRRGSHELKITVADRAGNVTVVSQTIMTLLARKSLK